MSLHACFVPAEDLVDLPSVSEWVGVFGSWGAPPLNQDLIPKKISINSKSGVYSTDGKRSRS